MAASRGSPNVRHSFEGETQLQFGTFDRRMQIRELLVELQKDIQESHGSFGQILITADIKITIAGAQAKNHTYHVDIGDHEQAPNAALRQKPREPNGPNKEIVDLESIQPHKRARTDSSINERPDQFQMPSTNPQIAQASGSMGESGNDTLKFLQNWQQQWHNQGGWMYDHLTKMTDEQRRKQSWTEKKIDGVQGSLAALLNLQHTQIMNELASMGRAPQWLEACRKGDYDKSESREEKWRLSSANFHDTTRKELVAELKEQREEMQEQHKMLTQLLEVQGLDEDPPPED